jgi:hypothetical protein
VPVVWKEETAVLVRERARVERTALGIAGGNNKAVFFFFPTYPTAFRVFQYSVVLPNFPAESIKQSKAQIVRPQSARDAPCHSQRATQTGSALWLALAGGQHRVTAVISKATVVGGQSSVVLSKHHRGARKLHEHQTSSCIVLRGYRAAAHGDRCPQCCLSFVSLAHTVVLENAGTRGLYTKPCFSSRL